MTGADFPMTLTLKNPDATPININNLVSLEILVYQKKEQVIQSWDLDAGITIVSASQGQVSIILDRANTEGLPEKPIYMQVLRGTSNAGADGGVLVESSAPKLIANVVNSAAND